MSKVQDAPGPVSAAKVSTRAGASSSKKGSPVSRLVAFIRSHPRPFKIAFYVLVIAGVAAVAHSQLKELSGEQMAKVLSSTPPIILVELVALGFLAFTATGIYDIFASRHFGVEIPVGTAAKIGWIAQAFNNFAGLGGLTGGAIRSRYYKRAGASTKAAVDASVAVWAANLLGLFAMLLATLPFAFRYDGRFLVVPVVACLYIPVYFLAGKVHFWKIDLRTTAIGTQNFRQKLQMLFASVADWLAAAVFFWICVRTFLGEVSFVQAVFVYATATLVGLLSFIPAGLGTFDLTVIVFFQHLGFDSSTLVLAIIVYRVTYYALPWLAATVYWLAEYAYPRLGLEDREKRERWLINALSTGVVILGIFSIVNAFAPSFYARVALLHVFLPHEMIRSSRIVSLLVGIMLLILARGVRQRVSRIFPIILILLGVAAVASVARGLDTGAIIVIILFAILLYLARGAFNRDPLPFEWRSFAFSAVIAVGIPLGIFAWRWIHGAPQAHVHPTAHALLTGVSMICFVSLISLALLFSRSRAPHFELPTPEDVHRFETFMGEHNAGNAFTHLFYLGDKQVFYSSNGRAALLYRPYRSSMLVLGDPFGDEASFEELFEEFVTYADEHGCSVAIYEIADIYLGACANIGFSFVKIGEDATVDLATYSNVGNKGKVFRRMRNRMGEKGTHFEVHFPPYTPEFIGELREVSDAWLGKRSEMGFSLGFFDASYIGRTPVLLVRGEERIEGFASLMPMAPGVASVDLMRIRPDAPGGTMDGIFVSLIEWAKENGYTHVNLGMAPMSNTGTTRFSRAREKVVRVIYDFGDRLYNFKGLRSYKEKFKPRWQSRYLAYTGTTALTPTILGLLDVIQHPDRSRGAIPLQWSLPAPCPSEGDDAAAAVPAADTQAARNMATVGNGAGGRDAASTNAGAATKHGKKGA
ncbi:bifunctional lysylphosphatidylglycerol flippase/synthetase MprF [Actinotignum sp. GS-2025b]|uniref:bifunctional lysylphosphatidylglycerol flippase/synthetase MprF n=1 Tax=Actinotignum sp. GS-2025b TaxID=3427275 RepID=UPI003F461931